MFKLGKCYALMVLVVSCGVMYSASVALCCVVIVVFFRVGYTIFYLGLVYFRIIMQKLVVLYSEEYRSSIMVCICYVACLLCCC